MHEKNTRNDAKIDAHFPIRSNIWNSIWNQLDMSVIAAGFVKGLFVYDLGICPLKTQIQLLHIYIGDLYSIPKTFDLY